MKRHGTRITQMALVFADEVAEMICGHPPNPRYRRSIFGRD
jgi:hypothetical protein